MLNISERSTSIVIPVCNQLFLTKQSVQAILDNTLAPYELVIVDNGSTDGTYEYFESLKQTVPVAYIRHDKNIGVVKAFNEGIKASKSKYVCTFHNDAIVQEKDWLGKMMYVFNLDEKIGLIGLAGRQLIDRKGRVDESTLVHSLTNEGLDTAPMTAIATEVATIDGFCFFTTKEIFEKMGGLDEVYIYMHTFDLELSLKMIKNGYKNVIANVKCLHINNGGNTRKTEQYRTIVPDDLALLNKNNSIFFKRWKRFLPVDKRNAPVIKA